MAFQEFDKRSEPFETRTVIVDGQPYQLRVEPSYWEALDEICEREGLPLAELCKNLSRQVIDGISTHEHVSLANAVRVFAVGYFRQAATESDHIRAGHGRGDPFIATPFGEDALVRPN